MTRVVIVGGPREGKSTLARLLGHPVLATDALMELGWSETSEAASRWFDQPGPWTVEGVATARALRKWLRANPNGKPCDLVIETLTSQISDRSPGQESMAKGVRTVFDQVSDDLLDRGVDLLVGCPIKRR